MKSLFITVFTLLSCSMISQNWSPILLNEKMNFKNSDSSFISHTIWIDHIDVTGDDSTFYINRVVKDIPGNPEFALRNQPQFLYAAMNKPQEGVYYFADPGFYILKTGANLNETWVFDLDNNTSAEITEILEEDIFGIIDSVKIISLSDGNEISISKSFGILSFPDYENGGSFEMVGVQGSEFGESVPGFWEIYSFEAGDVFQYSFFSANSSGGAYLDYIKKKYTIISKDIQGESILYTVEGIGKYYGYPIGGGGEYYLYSSTISETHQYFDSTNHICNKFNNELIRMWDCYSYGGSNNAVYSKLILRKDSNNLYQKEYGIINYCAGIDANLYYLQSESSDTLYKFEEPVFLDPEGQLGNSYSEKVGWINSFWAYWEGEESFHLEGYIVDGDTFGIITPDSLLIVGINKNNDLHMNCNIFPNPASNNVHVVLPYLHSKEDFYFIIRNFSGSIIYQSKIKSKTEVFDTSSLDSGIYLYSIYHHKNGIKSGKLIIQ